MNTGNLKQFVPHIIAVVCFAVLTLLFFKPLVEGKKLIQGDIVNFKGMSQEINDFRDKYDEEPLWTNSMFGGMPAYQISVKYAGNFFKSVERWFTKVFPPPSHYLFLYMIGFYILLMCFKVDPMIALIGAIAFGFSTYFIIILQAGHNSKANAIVYLAPLLASIVITYRGRYLLGGALCALFFSLELKANHVQITYYFGFVMLTYLGFKLYEAFREKQLPGFAKASGIMAIAVLLGIGSNITSIWATYEYSKYTTRGPSELTNNKQNKTSGLDKDYVTAWSYGVGETFTLLVPNFKGGVSQSLAADKEAIKDVSVQNQQIIPYATQYWGAQPFTSGPVYIGAIVMFLAVFGFLILKGPLKWSMLFVTILTIMLSWGKNFMFLTDIFLDYFPMYNKFRAVSMLLVIAELALPVIAFIGLDHVLKNPEVLQEKKRQLFIAVGITGGLCLLMWVTPTSFTDFTAASDSNLTAQLQGAKMTSTQINGFWSEAEAVREGIFRADAGRSAAFILLAFGALFLFGRNILKKNIVVGILFVLVLSDLWIVNKRYINEEKEQGVYKQ